MSPDDRKYSKEHEWVKMEDATQALAGITVYAQDQLGGILHLDTSIAMGYVDASHAEAGNMLEVDIRGRTAPVEVTPLPFYTRPRR